MRVTDTAGEKASGCVLQQHFLFEATPLIQNKSKITGKAEVWYLWGNFLNMVPGKEAAVPLWAAWENWPG